jgi:hypothetical protein
MTSSAQTALTDRLLAERDVPAEYQDRLTAQLAVANGRERYRINAWLMTLPRVAGGSSSSTPTDAKVRAEEGFYVRGDDVFKVKWNKARTGTYALRFVVSGGKARFDYAPGVGRSLAEEGLVPMTAADAARIGLHHGFCVNCCAELGGATLSANVSAAIGYGETCAKRNGWYYPKGAAAQRAYIAEAA